MLNPNTSTYVKPSAGVTLIMCAAAGVLLGDFAARLANTGVVEQDHERGGCERVDEQRVLMVEHVADVNVCDQQER
jgi:hypothetical protein